MHPLRFHDLEPLAASSEDGQARARVPRRAEPSRLGRSGGFLRELEHDRELDEETEPTVAALARDATFLQAVEDGAHGARSPHRR